jgi:CDP-diacylglycerol--serine O-phosphatidyltransferase
MPGKRRLRRGIYLLPTTFTVGNLFCGFFSLVLASQGKYELAAIVIIVAGILDGLDGWIARLTGTTSEFGVQFDSLADIVSFGIAPAFLAYHWALLPLRRVGWLIAFLYVVCAAMRLARYNLQVGISDKRYFVGLPSPSAAGMIACAAFAFPLRSAERWVSILVGVLVVGVAGLMISRFRYRSFKNLDLRHRRPYIYALAIAGALVFVFSHPKGALMTLAALYVASAPTAYLWSVLRRGRIKVPEPVPVGSETTEALDGSAFR